MQNHTFPNQLMTNPIEALLRLAAVSPPLVKRLPYRALAKLHSLAGPRKNVSTNLGLSSSLRINFIDDPGPVLLYGTPIHHVGERGALELLAELLSDCEGFVDIGANFGLYTFAAAVWRQGRGIPIVSVEPIPTLSERITENVVRSSLDHVTVLNAAVGAVQGEVTFQVDTEDHTLSSLIKNPNRPQREILVTQTTLDEIVREHTPGRKLLVKIDVENAEHEVLEGLQEFALAIDYFLLEVCLPGQKRKTIENVCHRLDLHPYYIDHFSLHFAGRTASFNYSPGQVNWLLTRLEPQELASRLSNSKLSVHY